MNNLTTLSHKLRIARNEADEEVYLDLTIAGDYDSKPSILGDTGKGIVDILGEKFEGATETEVNGIEFMFSGGSEAGKTFSWRIIAWRNSNGPARIMAEGTGELGTQALVKYPHNGATATSRFWADNLVITYENWMKEVEVTDTGNSNSVASIWCDAAGYRYWLVEIADADGLTEAGDIAVFWGMW